MPQPLPKRLYDTEIHISNSYDSPSNNRPELALLAMSVIAEWSILDSMFNAVFVRLLGSSADVGAAIYGSLSGAAAQRSAFKAVAKTKLSSEQYEVFSAIASLVSTVRAERNTIAHGVWGHAKAIPKGVLLIDPADLIKLEITIVDQEATKETFNKTNFPLDKIQVFYEVDFKNMSKRINRLMTLVKEFTIIISPNPGKNLGGQELAKLALQPEIDEAISLRRLKQTS